MIQNPSFEAGLRYFAFSSLGKYVPSKYESLYEADSSVSKFGNSSLKIHALREVTNPCSIGTFAIPVQAGQKYTVSCYAKGDRDNGLTLNMHSVSGQWTVFPKLGDCKITKAWRRYEFSFTAPSLTAPERVKILYQLEGWDATWQDGTATHRDVYGRLPAGNYRFHVIARGQEGAWNREGAALFFTVLPTIWQTLWFRWVVGFTVAALLGTGIRFVFMRRLRLRMAEAEREQALYRERERIAADLHDEVGASLTHIAQLSELARREDPDGSFGARLEQLTRASRKTIEILDEIVWTMNMRNDSLQHLVGYLGDYTREFFSTSNIQLHTDLPENLPEVTLTSKVRYQVLLVVKESLNNAMKHSGAMSVSLSVTVEDAQLKIVVRDNGKGFTPGTASTGVGLSNLSRRLQSSGGSLQLASSPGQGTIVTISLPLNNIPSHLIPP
ncbi:MAG: ATP-binding protein [Verrucomicrobiota bacterium]